MITKKDARRGLPVKLNSNFIQKCLGDKYLMEEETSIHLADGIVYNDQIGDYVFIKGDSGINSGYAYLDQLDKFEMSYKTFKRAYNFLVNANETEEVVQQKYSEFLKQ